MPRKVSSRFLIFGSTLVLVGAVLLIGTLGIMPLFAPFWPLLFVIGGGWILHAGIVGRAREAAVFVGLFLILGGTVFLLSTTVMDQVELRKVWPLFMAIAGVSLIAYSRKKQSPARLNLSIPGFAMVFLSVVFLLFSFDLVDEDFISLVSAWWPLLFVFAGVALLVTHFLSRRVDGVTPTKNNADRDENTPEDTGA